MFWQIRAATIAALLVNFVMALPMEIDPLTSTFKKVIGKPERTSSSQPPVLSKSFGVEFGSSETLFDGINEMEEGSGGGRGDVVPQLEKENRGAANIDSKIIAKPALHKSKTVLCSNNKLPNHSRASTVVDDDEGCDWDFEFSIPLHPTSFERNKHDDVWHDVTNDNNEGLSTADTSMMDDQPSSSGGSSRIQSPLRSTISQTTVPPSQDMIDLRWSLLGKSNPSQLNSAIKSQELGPVKKNGEEMKIGEFDDMAALVDSLQISKSHGEVLIGSTNDDNEINDIIDQSTLTSQLKTAIKSLDLDRVKKLLDTSSNPLALITSTPLDNLTEFSALHFSATLRDTRILEFLLHKEKELSQRGSSVFVTTTRSFRSTPLHVAVMNEHTEATKFLMSHDKANAMILAQDLHRDTPLMLAVGRGHSGHVKLILDHLNEEWEAGITDPATQLFMHHSINLHGDTLLHKAAKLGKPRVMSELMDWMERVLVLVNNNGLKTTMTSWFNHQNQNGDTAMHVAARLGHNYNIQNLRLRSQTVDWRDPTECIRLLLGGGGRRRRSGDKEGEEGDLVKSDATADAELENRSGDTPLEIAVREGDEEMLDVFRAANARYADLIQTMKEEAEGMLGDENDEGEGGDWDDSESGEVTTKSTDSRRSSISRDSDDLDKVILNLEE